MPDEDKEQKQKGSKKETPPGEPGEQGEQEEQEEQEKSTDNVSRSDYQEILIKYETLKSQVETEKEKQLQEKEDFKSLYEQEKQKTTRKDEIIKEKELQLAAKEVFKDPKDILFFKDRFEFDANMNITNAKEIMEKIKKEKPYLFKEGKKEVPKTDVSKVPLDIPTGHIFKRTELRGMSRDEYKKHKKEIMRQMSEGLIIDDIKEEK